MDRSSEKVTRVSTPAFDITQTAEAGGEFTMPDYYPEIRKVISVSADALPDSKYISDSGLELGGALAFTLLYIGDDGAISSVPYVTEYSHTFPLKDRFEGGTGAIHTESFTESVFCRPLAPRTVSLRAKVKSRARADRSEDCSTILTDESSSALSPYVRSTVQRLEKELPTVFLQNGTVTGNCSGEISNQANTKPVSCKGQMIISSVQSGKDRITVKGEMAVSCLVLSGDGIYKTINHRLPFEEIINAEGCDKDCRCGASGRAASVTVTTEDDGTLSVEGEYDIDAVWAMQRITSYTQDLYSTDCKTEKTQQHITAQSLLCLENSSMPLTGEGRRKTERSEGDHVISASAVCRPERLDVRDKKAALLGTCTFKILIASGGDVLSEDVELPFRYECPVLYDSGDLQRMAWNANVTAHNAKCTIEDSKLQCQCNMNVFLCAVGETDISPVIKGVVGAKDRENGIGSVIRVCYPEEGRRIWDIAKECRASAGLCERINRVSRFDLSDGTPLIIK